MKESKKKVKKEGVGEEIKQEINENVVFHRRERHGGFGAVILITVGILLLLNNFELLPWSVWESLLKFWPVLLIFAGIETIFGRSWLGGIITTLIGISITWLIVANVLSLTVPEFNSWLTQNFPQFKIESFQNYLRDKGVK